MEGWNIGKMEHWSIGVMEYWKEEKTGTGLRELYSPLK
jgi:hypothetical protein